MRDELDRRYRDYIACLNRRDWDDLRLFVDADVVHNGTVLGVAGYRAMLERDVAAIPDLQFEIHFLVIEAPHVAARLQFDCTPTGDLFSIPVDGRRIRFTENVFYGFAEGLIRHVWSVIDLAAIRAQV